MPVSSSQWPAKRAPLASVQSVDTRSRSIAVIRPGLFTTIQDQGRWGHQSSGVSVSGALDQVSSRREPARRKHGKRGDTQVTLAGPELRIEEETRIAITGADLAPTIDGAATSLEPR